MGNISKHIKTSTSSFQMRKKNIHQTRIAKQRKIRWISTNENSCSGSGCGSLGVAPPPRQKGSPP